VPPADAGHRPTPGADPGRAGRSGPVIHIRCERCFAVLRTRHPWDTVDCRCGALTLSGRPWRPHISCRVVPGGGWSQVAAEPEPDVATPAARGLEQIGYGR